MFEGFKGSVENWTKIPHELWDYISEFNGSEFKILCYILRHTWGYNEYEDFKVITLDEFTSGRKSREGERLDKGTGLSKPSVVGALQVLLEKGFIEERIDDSDKARVKKGYRVRVLKNLVPVLKNFTPDVKKLNTDQREKPREKENPSGGSVTTSSTGIKSAAGKIDILAKYPWIPKAARYVYDFLLKQDLLDRRLTNRGTISRTMDDWEQTLRLLVESDHYTEDEVKKTLHWLCKTDNWWITTKNFRSIPALRKENRDGLQKFSVIFNSMKKDKTPDVNAAAPMQRRILN